MASIEQKAALAGMALVSVIAVVTALDAAFGWSKSTKDLDIERLVSEAKARQKLEQRGAMDEAAEKVGRWRRAIERKAIMGAKR